MKILIDNGHGSDTPGKRSPDGKFLEYRYNRIIAARVVSELKDCDYDAELLVPEETDIPLPERVRRVNAHCAALGQSNVLLVSIHVNAAASDGKWHTATGWSAYTSRGNTAADALATCLYESAARHLPGHRLRTDYADGDPDIESGFYILRHTLCPAVLTENGFMDSRESLAFITSASGKDAIVGLHVEGIVSYLECLTN